MYNKKSLVGLHLTAEFSEVVKTALDQQTPDYLTYTRLTDLVNNTVSFFYFLFRDYFPYYLDRKCKVFLSRIFHKLKPSFFTQPVLLL